MQSWQKINTAQKILKQINNDALVFQELETKKMI